MEIEKEQSYKLRVSEDKISLYLRGENSNKVVTNLLLFFPIIICFILIGTFAYLANLGEGIPFGFLISCIIGCGTSIYFIRMFLWNKYGQEVFVIEKDKFTVYNDYGFFKDNYQTYPPLSKLYMTGGKDFMEIPSECKLQQENDKYQIVFLVKRKKYIFSKSRLLVKDIIKIKDSIEL